MPRKPRGTASLKSFWQLPVMMEKFGLAWDVVKLKDVTKALPH